MSEQATGTPRDLEVRLITRAWEDEAFKQEMLRDPTAVVGRELRRQHPELRLPKQVQSRALQETPTERHLMPPAKPTIESGEERSDAHLELVATAGGRMVSWSEGTCHLQYGIE